MKILIGTNNQDKLAQYRRVFQEVNFDAEILSLADLQIDFDVEEDGDNLLHNAQKKAREYAEISGLLTMADDTGLFVDALDGEPGIHAKRWHAGTEYERCLKLLDRMKDVPKDQRSARYIGVVATYDPRNKEIWFHETKAEGFIVGSADEMKGDNGFGYDPILHVTSFGKNYAELSNSEIDVISHRTNGIREFIKKYLNK
ncbi:MAG: non-canonical purine NTP pyrophosphatase [Candidatus Moranbacteria bacterium]|nr:non-canonical purine NTP pyrophosphatase [Candidatus Moranbacteria bacterium]